MSFIEQAIIQLIVAGIAFLAGFFVQRIRTTLAYFRTRRFWRPPLRRDLALILGDGFLDLKSFEASNVVGRGDLVASYELTTYFSKMGFRRLQPIFADRTVGADLTGRPLRRNLIVLGGPDANRISLHCLYDMQLSYILEWQEIGSQGNESIPRIPQNLPRLAFRGSDSEEHATFEAVSKNGEVARDYGVIIRTHNPFMPRNEEAPSPRRGERVVVIYGCYGYGTLAAVLYSQSPQFLEMVGSEGDDIECIVTCRVVEGTPQSPDCVYFKTHSYGSLLSRIITPG